MDADFKPVTAGKGEEADLFVKGLATPAYLTMRGKEECYRVRRYGRPLALVVIRLLNPDPATERRLQNWLRSDVRASDVPAHLGNANYAVLLPESSANDATYMVNRMCMSVPRVQAVSVGCPDDGATWDELYECGRQKLGRKVGAPARGFSPGQAA